MIAAAALIVAAVFATSQRPALRHALVSAGLFVLLGAMALGINAGWLAALDTSVEAWLETFRTNERRIEAGKVFRYIGEPRHMAVAGMVGGGLLALVARSPVPAALVVGAVGLGFVVEHALKATVTRTSTAVAEMQGLPLNYHEHGFPSGHVTGSLALLGTIAVCLGAGRSRPVRAALGAVVAAAAVAVAFLAVYTRAHTFTEVVGGALLGSAIVVLAAALAAVWRRNSAASVRELHADLGRERRPR